MISREGGQLALGVAIGFLSTVLFIVTFDQLDQTNVDRTILGAIIGGFLAGLFGVVAAMISGLYAKDQAARRKAMNEEVILHSILTKLIDLKDLVTKQKRHFMIHDASAKVFFGDPPQRNSFSKPLEGKKRDVEFTVEERAFLLRAKGSQFFNDLANMQGVADGLAFLLDRHKEAYYALMDEVQKGDFQRAGYLMSGGLNKDSPRLIAMMDLDGALASLLHRAEPEVAAFLARIVEFSNEKTSVRIGYEQTGLPPSSENDRRQEF